MTGFFQQLVNGLFTGSIYTPIVLGCMVICGIIKLIGFAHDDIYILSAYVEFISIAQLHLGSFPVLLLTMMACGVLGVIIERAAYKPLRNAIRTAALTTVIGVSYFLEYSTQKIMGPGVKTYPSVLNNQTFHVLGVQTQMQQIYTPAITIIPMLALQFIVRKTKTGRSMCTVSVDADAVKLMRINADAMISYILAVGSALAGVGGVLVGMYYSTVNPLMGMVPGIKAFAAAVFGGIGIISGTMFSGFLIGIAEAFVTAYRSSLYRDTVVYAISILTLAIKPAGPLSKNVKEKVQVYETYLQ